MKISSGIPKQYKEDITKSFSDTIDKLNKGLTGLKKKKYLKAANKK